MAHAGPTEGRIAALPVKKVIDHRKLVAKIFSRSATEAKPDVPAVDIEDQEMFHCAASQGMLSSILALLANGNLPCDSPDRFGRTPLHWAAEQGHRNVVLALLRAGSCVDPRSQRKATPIMLAASSGYVNVVGVLLRFGAGESDCSPLNHHRRSIDHWRRTALHCAAAGGHAAVVALLLGNGFDREQHDGAGLIPAEISARTSYSTSPAITRILLPTGDNGGKLVYDYVDTMMQDVGIVSGLAKGGAFLDWRAETGDAPLHRAAHFHHAAIAKVLLRWGADPNIRNHHGASPLHVAACTEHGEIVAELLQAGADVETLTKDGFSPLHMAVVNNRLKVVLLLLIAGASMEHRDTTHGQTPLSWACKNCFAPIVRILVEAGADVESRSSAGLTPLHWACRFYQVDSVEALLNAGADPGAVDRAAADAAAPRPSRSGTRVLIPVAVDVIGLGYPFDRTDYLWRPFRGGSWTLTASQSDIFSGRCIELALRDAKQECSWRRRGWLVILANRWVVMEARAGAGCHRWAFCRGGSNPLTTAVVKSRDIYTDVEHPDCAHQKESTSDLVSARSKGRCSDSSESHPLHHELSDGQNDAGKRLKSVDDVVMIARATPCQHGQTRGDVGAQKNMESLLPDVVAALLGLIAVEVDLFRRVVMFV